MKNNIKKWSAKLKPIANLITYIMAIFGFIILASNIFSKIYQTISFKNILGIARPICEPYLFLLDNEINYPYKNPLMIGVSIETFKDLTGVRVSFKHLEYVVRWAIKSDSISIIEKNEFIKKLPIGEVSSFITPPLPKLNSDTTTTISAIIKISADKFLLQNELINVTSNEGKILHLDLINRNIRGMILALSVEEWLLISLVFVLIITIFKILKKKNKLKKVN